MYYKAYFLSIGLNKIIQNMQAPPSFVVNYSLCTLAIAQTSCSSWLHTPFPLHRDLPSLVSLSLMGIFHYLTYYSLFYHLEPENPSLALWTIKTLSAVILQTPALCFGLGMISPTYSSKEIFLQHPLCKTSFHFFSLQPFLFLVPLTLKTYYRMVPQTYLFHTLIFLFLCAIKTILERKNTQYILQNKKYMYITSPLLITLHATSLLHTQNRIQTFCLMFQECIHIVALVKNIIWMSKKIFQTFAKNISPVKIFLIRRFPYATLTSLRPPTCCYGQHRHVRFC